MRADDPYDARLQEMLRDFDASTLNEYRLMLVMFLSEHGVVSPEALLTLPMNDPWAARLNQGIMSIAQALAAADDDALAAAINEAERYDIVVHAARMRLILAERTRDLAQLERAHAILERIGDRVATRRAREALVALGVS
jgi:hypothetical protein